MSLPDPGSLPSLERTGWHTATCSFTGKGSVGKTTTASAVNAQPEKHAWPKAAAA